MAPLPVIPFILTIIAAVNQTSKPFHQELSMLSSLSAAGPTFICSGGPIPLFAELYRGPLTNQAKIFGKATFGGVTNRVYWTVQRKDDGTASIAVTENSADASIFVLKTEQGDIHEGGRFNIELAASGSQPALLVETEVFHEATPRYCSLQKLAAKPASLSRAIDRYQQIEQESSGAEESTPQSSVDYTNYPVMGIAAPNYCSQKPQNC